jgi:two-component system cell cycle sensor histidine kinase/response regulator CckA
MKLAREIIDALDQPICVLSHDFGLLVANRAFLELVALPDVVDCNLGVLWPSLREDCRVDGAFSTSWYRYSGEVVTVRGVTCKTEQSVLVRVEASSESGEAAVQDYHKQRIETLGMLAGGVAHDFNNVLTGVLGHVAFLKHKVDSQGDAYESLLAIEDGALRGADLVKQILMFSRLDSSQSPKPVDVEQSSNGVLTLLKSAIPSRIGVSIETLESIPKLMATEAQVNQILINLIINARDAIDGDGSIQVRLGGVVPSSNQSPFNGEKRCIAICVEDTGMGMAPELIERIFEPYFSTKERRGTGLGLSTVHQIVTELGGLIEVQSEVGLGTTFKVFLPALDERAHSEASVGIPNLRRGRGQRILVIDDEDAVRNVLSLSLSHLGYVVDVASSGEEGLARITETAQPYELVMLDILMPDMAGDKLFEEMRERQIDSPVLVMSGFSSEHVVEKMLKDGARGFIRKPFSIEALSERVEEILNDSIL